MSQLDINTLTAQSGSVIHLSSHVSGSSISTGSFGRVETGNLTVGGSQGSDGQVLTSTGGGVGWEDAAGGVDGITSTANATAITIDSSENVKLGGSPDNWDSVRALQFGGGDYEWGSALSWGGGAVWAYLEENWEPHFNVSENVYFNDILDEELYSETNKASLYRQQQGTHTFKVAPSGTADNSVSWTTGLQITNDGEITKPNNPAFYAYIDSIMGPNSTHGTVSFSGTSYNIGSHYSTSTYTFTAPVDGIYSFTLNVSVENVETYDSNYWGFNFVVGGVHHQWQFIIENWDNLSYFSKCISREFQMDANDTCYVYLDGSGSTHFHSMMSGNKNCSFSGHLIG